MSSVRMTLLGSAVDAAGIGSVPTVGAAKQRSSGLSEGEIRENLGRLVPATVLPIHDSTPREMQGAVDRVTLDRDQPALDVGRQPPLRRRCEPAQHGDAGGAAFGQATHQFVVCSATSRTMRRPTGSPWSAWRITIGARAA